MCFGLGGLGPEHKNLLRRHWPMRPATHGEASLTRKQELLPHATTNARLAPKDTTNAITSKQATAPNCTAQKNS